MANYQKTTDFTVKDSLPTGDPSKKVLGAEIDNEFAAVEISNTTKADKVTGGTAGHLSALDNTGNITDSGIAVSDLTDLAFKEEIELSDIPNGLITNDKMATNTLQGNKIAANAIGNSELASNSVKRSNLDTSEGTVSGLAQLLYAILNGADPVMIPTVNIAVMNGTFRTLYGDFLMPGGAYGFYPQIRRLPPIEARQRYINSSPPYNMGDGQIELFIFLMYRNGELNKSYVADVPPWAYNGNTSIEADIYDKNGVGYKYYNKYNKPDWITSDNEYYNEFVSVENLNLRERLEARASDEILTIPVTDELKNYDMNTIEHPFTDAQQGDEIILLDPMSDTLNALKCANDCGESIHQLILTNDISVEQEVNRTSPDSVICKEFNI